MNQPQGRGRRKKGWWRRWPVLLALVLPLALLGSSTARTWTIFRPPAPPDAATIFVSDYGRHARLALPWDEDWLVEYAFGDWDYYARAKRTPWRGAVALLVPTEATLARRFVPFTAEEDEFKARAGSVRSVRLSVERNALADLTAQLDQRYRQQMDTETYLPDLGLSFVKDDHAYHLFHNSNHRVAAWLQSLGCEVRGTPILSNFEVRPPGKDLANSESATVQSADPAVRSGWD